MDLVSMLVMNEGLRLKPYRCTAGKLTIGVGRNLDDTGITKEEALKLLDDDIIRVEAELQKNLPWYLSLSEARKAVLIDMCFNLGIVGLLAFKTTLSLIKDGKYKEAAIAMLQSKWASQVKNRAERNAALMESGDWLK